MRSAAFLSVLSRRIAAAFDRAFVGEAFLALEKMSFSPSRRHWRHLASRSRAIRVPLYAAAFSAADNRCGARAFTSAMLLILRPSAFRARTADSRPGPGPLMRTLEILHPTLLCGAAGLLGSNLAANGVDFLEPLKPAAPEVAHAKALPWRSVMVTMVLLNEA